MGTVMSVHYTLYEAYGVQVDPDKINWELRETLENPSKHNGVQLFPHGRYDDPDWFLVTEVHELEPGNFRLFEPGKPATIQALVQYSEWDKAIYSVALQYRLDTLTGTGWFIIPGES